MQKNLLHNISKCGRFTCSSLFRIIFNINFDKSKYLLFERSLCPSCGPKKLSSGYRIQFYDITKIIMRSQIRFFFNASKSFMEGATEIFTLDCLVQANSRCMLLMDISNVI